jgi:hypothetical protein
MCVAKLSINCTKSKCSSQYIHTATMLRQNLFLPTSASSSVYELFPSDISSISSPRGDPRGDRPRIGSPRGDLRGFSPRGYRPRKIVLEDIVPRGNSPRGDSPRGVSPRGGIPMGNSRRGDRPRGDPRGGSPRTTPPGRIVICPSRDSDMLLKGELIGEGDDDTVAAKDSCEEIETGIGNEDDDDILTAEGGDTGAHASYNVGEEEVFHLQYVTKAKSSLDHSIVAYPSVVNSVSQSPLAAFYTPTPLKPLSPIQMLITNDEVKLMSFWLICLEK